MSFRDDFRVCDDLHEFRAITYTHGRYISAHAVKLALAKLFLAGLDPGLCPALIAFLGDEVLGFLADEVLELLGLEGLGRVWIRLLESRQFGSKGVLFFPFLGSQG